MLEGGLVSTVYTFRCVWCRREEKVTATIDNYVNLNNAPDSWHWMDHSVRAKLLCSSDCKAEFEEAKDLAYKKCIAKHGMPEPGCEFPGFWEELHRLRDAAARQRQEKFL